METDNDEDDLRAGLPESDGDDVAFRCRESICDEDDEIKDKDDKEDDGDEIDDDAELSRDPLAWDSALPASFTELVVPREAAGVVCGVCVGSLSGTSFFQR